MNRTFLMLQGPASPFFSKMALGLQRAGHKAHRINFCGGDLLYSLFQPHTNYKGSMADLPGWLASEMKRHAVTDLLLYGDCRPIHRAAIAVATEMDVRVHVFEEGYLRPDWITMELGGVNGHSRMMDESINWGLGSTPIELHRDDLAYLAGGGSNTVVKASYDIAYRLASTLLSWLFPHYRTHRPYNGVLEYAGLARRFAMMRWYDREARQVTASLRQQSTPYFIFPLQLNADFQIRCHSPFPDVIASIDAVLTSFAQAHVGTAAKPVQLLLKNHPLDTGLSGYRAYVQRRAAELNLTDRVKFIEAGDLPELLVGAKGVILVNSTVGLTALALGCPVYAMGKAIFNKAGLSYQGELETFWRAPTPPDATLVRVFLAHVKTHSQVKGDFYLSEGLRHAAQVCVRRMMKAVP